MTKAYFIDYTGTMVQEDEPYTRELLSYFVTHSDIRDSKEILKIVWGKVMYGERSGSMHRFLMM